MRKWKTLGTKLTMLLVGAFQVKLFCNFFIREWNTSFRCAFLLYQKFFLQIVKWNLFRFVHLKMKYIPLNISRSWKLQEIVHYSWFKYIKYAVLLIWCYFNIFFFFWRHGKWKLIMFFHARFSAVRSLLERKF